MEEQHSRLRAQPPEPGADADAYFECRGNARAMAYVRHAVLRGESFVVLTGAAGTGKTALLAALMSEPGPVGVVSGRLAGTRLDAAGLLAAAAEVFGVPAAGDGVGELRAALQAWLAMLTATDRRALLIVDNAQHLLPAALRELTELASLRSSRDAPMQVVMAGRPELRLSLQHALRGVAAEPVFLFCDVGPLSVIETRWYVEHRLRRVAGPERPLFTDEAYVRIHHASGGVPRAINQLCDRVLAIAAQRRIGCVGAEGVDEAAAALQPRHAGPPGVEGGARTSGAEPLDTALHETKPSTRAAGAGSSARRTVIAVSLLGVAAFVAWGIHEYEGLMAADRLSSLAAATRQAPAAPAPTAPAPTAPAPPLTPAALLPAAPNVSATPAVPTPPAMRSVPRAHGADAVISTLPDAAPRPPPPAAPPCSEVVIALGLCSPEARQAELP